MKSAMSVSLALIPQPLPWSREVTYLGPRDKLPRFKSQLSPAYRQVGNLFCTSLFRMGEIIAVNTAVSKYLKVLGQTAHPRDPACHGGRGAMVRKGSQEARGFLVL